MRATEFLGPDEILSRDLPPKSLLGVAADLRRGRARLRITKLWSDAQQDKDYLGGSSVNIIKSLATWVDTLGPSLRSRSVLESELFHSRPDVKYMRFPECIIRYRVSRSGPRTLVLATDPPVVVEQYDKLIELLKNDFRVVVFEIPGFGFSVPTLSHGCATTTRASQAAVADHLGRS